MQKDEITVDYENESTGVPVLQKEDLCVSSLMFCETLSRLLCCSILCHSSHWDTAAVFLFLLRTYLVPSPRRFLKFALLDLRAAGAEDGNLVNDSKKGGGGPMMMTTKMMLPNCFKSSLKVLHIRTNPKISCENISECLVGGLWSKIRCVWIAIHHGGVME